MGPLLYRRDSSVGDDDHKQIAFQNIVHLYASHHESVLCNGHKVVDKTTGHMIQFRVVVVHMEDLEFRPQVLYNRLREAGLGAKREFDERFFGESPKGFRGLGVGDKRDPWRSFVMMP